MNVVSLHKHNFNHRRGAESQTEFTAKYMNIEHTSIIKEIAEKNNLDFEVAAAYAMAMFCGMEDLMLFHHDVELPGFSITVKKGCKKIKGWKEKLKTPYLKNITDIHDQVKKYLANQNLRDNNKTERLAVKERGKVFFSEQEKLEYLEQKRIKRNHDAMNSEWRKAAIARISWDRAKRRAKEVLRKKKARKKAWQNWRIQQAREHFSY